MDKFIYIYCFRIPFDYPKINLCNERKEYLKTVDPLELDNSRWVWRLLNYALKDKFSIYANSLHPRRLETGRWVFDNYYISLSHSAHFCAVAISSDPIGIDIQKDGGWMMDVSRFSQSELQMFHNHSVVQRLITWTNKEALYKYLDPCFKYVGNEASVDTVKYRNYFRNWLQDGYPGIAISICSKLIFDKKKYGFDFVSNVINEIREIDPIV